MLIGVCCLLLSLWFLVCLLVFRLFWFGRCLLLFAVFLMAIDCCLCVVSRLLSVVIVCMLGCCVALFCWWLWLRVNLLLFWCAVVVAVCCWLFALAFVR